MIKASVEGEIILDGVIGSDWYSDGITMASVSNALDKLGGKRATIRINSPGGASDEGIAIYNLLKRYKGGVDTVNESLAASAASLIFLAGENRTMATGSRVMIHKAWTIGVGNADSMRKTAETLDSYDRSMIEIYALAMDKSEEEIMQLLSEETWYNTQEAIDAKLATAKTDAKAKPASMAMASWIKHPPQDLVEQMSKASYAKIKLGLAM
jgi:ATP-dependent Clp protease protease subunit